MGSTTNENEKRMVDSLSEADVVLWVVDSSAIGNIREIGFIQQLQKSGMPLCVVVTKCDLNDVGPSEQKEIAEYLDSSVRNNAKNIFFTSSLNKGRNETLKVVEDYLDKNYRVSRADIRKKANEAFQYRMKNEIVTDFKEIYSRLIVLRTQININRSKIEAIRDVVCQEMKIEIEHIFNEKIFKTISSEFMKNAEKSNDHNKILSSEKLQEIITDSISSKNVVKEWKR